MKNSIATLDCQTIVTWYDLVVIWRLVLADCWGGGWERWKVFGLISDIDFERETSVWNPKFRWIALWKTTIWAFQMLIILGTPTNSIWTFGHFGYPAPGSAGDLRHRGSDPQNTRKELKAMMELFKLGNPRLKMTFIVLFRWKLPKCWVSSERFRDSLCWAIYPSLNCGFFWLIMADHGWSCPAWHVYHKSWSMVKAMF